MTESGKTVKLEETYIIFKKLTDWDYLFKTKQTQQQLNVNYRTGVRHINNKQCDCNSHQNDNTSAAKQSTQCSGFYILQTGSIYRVRQ